MNAQLKSKIMRRVYTVAFMRRFLRPFVIKSTLLAVLISLGAVFVSITNVIKNGFYSSNGVFELLAFMFRALSQTEAFVQLLFIGIVTLVVWMIVDKIREIEHGRMFAA